MSDQTPDWPPPRYCILIPPRGGHPQPALANGAVIWYHDREQLARQFPMWQVVELTDELLAGRRLLHASAWAEGIFDALPLPPANRIDMRPELVDQFSLCAGFEPGLAVRDAVWGTLREVARQLTIWGEQSHPDGTGEDFELHGARARVLAELMRRLVQQRATWARILLEEVLEALAESDLDRLDYELEQAGAVILSWRRDIARRREAGVVPSDVAGAQ